MRSIMTVLSAAAALAAFCRYAPSAATEDYPVPYTFAANLAGAARPYTCPPGADDWDYRPTAAHPRPVVLVHGFASRTNNTWQTYSPMLANENYCVFAINYGVPRGTPFPLNQIGGRARLQDSAAELAAFVDRVLAATGATKIDLIGHSEGIQMPQLLPQVPRRCAEVRTFVALAPFWRGTPVSATPASSPATTSSPCPTPAASPTA